MEEIIAEKQDNLISKFVVLLVLSVVCIFLAAAFYLENLVTAIIIATIFSLCIVVCIVVIILYLITPEDIAVYRSGKFKFNKFTCRPCEIENIEYRSYRSRYFGSQNGRLTVYYGGKKYIYQFVGEIKQAYEKLNELIEADKILAQSEREDVHNG